MRGLYSLNLAACLRLCKVKNLTLALSKFCGLSCPTLYSIQNGRNHTLRLTTLDAICTGLGITLYQFFDIREFNALNQIPLESKKNRKLSRKASAAPP